MKKVNGISLSQVNKLQIGTLVRNRSSIGKESAGLPLGNDESVYQELHHELTNPFIGEELRAIQTAKKELGIVNLAAIEPGTMLTYALITYFTTKYAHPVIKFFKDKVIKPMGSYWNDNLLSHNSTVREKAIQDIVEGTFENAQETTKQIELALREFIVSSRELTEDSLTEIRLTVRGLTSALEGLYQRNDVSTSRDAKNDGYGWNSHNWFLSKLLTITGVAKAVTDHFYSPGKLEQELDQFIGIPNLTQEAGWYEADIPNVFISLLEVSHKFPALDKESKNSMRRTLVRSWNLPVEKCKIPEYDRTNDYRLSIYREILSTLVEEAPFGGRNLTPDDPLYLRTDDKDIPVGLKSKATKLREDLLTALTKEIERYKTNDNYCQLAVDTLRAILLESKSIPKALWDPEIQKLLAVEKANNEKFIEFKKWAEGVCQISGDQLQKCFNALTKTQKDNATLLDEKNTLRHFWLANQFDSTDKLNVSIASILRFMNLDSQDQEEKLTLNNAEKGLFFLAYLNAILEKKVSIGNNQPAAIKSHLSIENRDYLLKVCKKLVYNKTNFPGARDINFYTKPPLDSVPGQALDLYHNLTYCFNEEGYVDTHGLNNLVLPNAVDTLSNTALKHGFILSGPHKNNISLFAKALANQLAINLFEINRDLVHSDQSISGPMFNFSIQLPNGRTGTLQDFTDFVIVNNPCVVLFNDADELLVPREEDRGRDKSKTPTKEEEDLTSAFFPHLDRLHNDAPGVILIMATDKPQTEKIEVSLLDENGYSDEAQKELFQYVSYAGIRGGRVDQKSFLLHKTTDQTNTAVTNDIDPKRQEYLKNKISSLCRAGKKQLKGTLDYIELTISTKGLTPQQIKTALEDLTPSELTQESILAAFEKARSEGKQ